MRRGTIITLAVAFLLAIVAFPAIALALDFVASEAQPLPETAIENADAPSHSSEGVEIPSGSPIDPDEAPLASDDTRPADGKNDVSVRARNLRG